MHARATPACARFRGCSWSWADIMAIRKNFICEIHKCQPFAKIFSREINPLYGTPDIYICKWKIAIQLTSVGLAHACPNYPVDISTTVFSYPCAVRYHPIDSKMLSSTHGRFWRSSQVYKCVQNKFYWNQVRMVKIMHEYACWSPKACQGSNWHRRWKVFTTGGDTNDGACVSKTLGRSGGMLPQKKFLSTRQFEGGALKGKSLPRGGTCPWAPPRFHRLWLTTLHQQFCNFWEPCTVSLP